MNCPKCQFENRASAKFCTRCRTKLPAACPHCGAGFEPGDVFCGECGAALSTATTAAAPSRPPASSAPAPAPSLEEQFTTLQQVLPQSLREHLLTPADGENRIVTVLFADMSRSVETTAGLHPEDAAALVNRLLKAMVDVLLKYEGRIDRFLGDGVLAVFGVPQAHESDPERAILAALDIREAARELGLQVTAGINTGEVYVGGVGSERYHELTVMGPVVNLASRLQESAEPGQILAGEATYRHTRRAFAFAPLTLAIRGIDRPAAAYVVERALPHPEKVRGIEGLRAELIGREEEFARLREALEEVSRGRGQMVSVIGEAGVGKSRLVSELKQTVGSKQSAGGSSPASHDPTASCRLPTAYWLEGRCLELGMTAGYWLFVDLFRHYFAWGPEHDDRARGQQIVACLQHSVVRGDLTAERVEEMGPLLGNLLSVRFGSAWDERLKNASPEQIRHQTFLAVHDFLVALAKQQPVVLLLEDLHWADSLSLDLVSLLMEALRLAPILLLCVYRPEREHKCWHLATIAMRKCPERFTEIHLRELTPPQSRRLVESLLAIDNLPASVKELILAKSRGNPFFVEEVLRSLIDAGMVYQEGEVWRAREGIETVAVPESVQSVILSRVDRLERNLKGVLESASVIGRLFRRRLLEYTTQETTELERALWELEDRQLIYQERVVPEEEFSFQHVLTQETIYQSILRRRRAVFHQQVAEAMETLYRDGLDEFYEQLAYHYDRSPSDEKAVAYLLKAGEKARQAYHNDEATRYFQRALERLDVAERGARGVERGMSDKDSAAPVAAPRSALHTPHLAWRLAALKGLGQVAHAVGRQAQAEEYLRAAIALGKEMGLPGRELIPLYHWLGEALWWLSRYDDGIAVAEEGLALLAPETESREAILMKDRIAINSMNKGDREAYRRFGRRYADVLLRLPYSEELRPAYCHVFEVLLNLERDEEKARKWLAEFERRAEQHHHAPGLVSVHQYAAMALRMSGDLHGSIARRQQGYELCARIGDIKHGSWALSGLGLCFLALGDLDQAEEYTRRALEIDRQTNMKRNVALSTRQLGVILQSRGALKAAEEAFKEAAAGFHEIGSPGQRDPLVALGRFYLGQGRREEAVQRFQEALTLSATDGIALAAALSGLEAALEDPHAFRVLCERFREEHPHTADPPLIQWYLEPAQAGTADRPPVLDERFLSSLAPGWDWHEPADGCSLVVQEGLEIHAANGQDLWQSNRRAPRLLRPVSGDFAAQTVAASATPEKPAIGGLLLWKATGNYLRLGIGGRGSREISLEGCLAGNHVLFGRGCLPSECAFLRLERQGHRVNALCSGDGEQWFTPGQVEFPADDPVEVGLHAIGSIDRAIYPGAYPEGTAIRFESFQLWS